MENLHIASPARALLENLQPARARSGLSKAWSPHQIEDYLDQLVRVHGEARLNEIRDHGRRIAPALGLTSEFEQLDKLIGAILGTRKQQLTSDAARARAQGAPYDPHRLELFTKLYAALKGQLLPRRHVGTLSDFQLRHLAFFEAYFSNYIEGTEFVVEEAADIVFRGRINAQRPADSHDVLGTYRIVSNSEEMNRVPASNQELLELLQTRHAVLLGGRPKKRPGQFKETANRAGETIFVAPELVTGTLAKGFDLYRSLEDPLARAMYMMFLVAEVHPFDDGNGRIARIMMNAELVRGMSCRIIIPTVYREDYLLAMRALTRQGNTAPYLHMLNRAQDFTSRIEFGDYDQALAQLRAAGAFFEPHQGKLLMPGKD